MGPRDPSESGPGPERPWPTGDDVLRNLEARLERASQAAERLVAEASQRTSGTTPGAHEAPPAAGWQAPDEEGPSTARELELLIGLVGSVRDLVPPELQQRLAEALRELLLAVRALIDWYLERVETRRTEPTEVQDIPIQ
jgi:hypothetical protein